MIQAHLQHADGDHETHADMQLLTFKHSHLACLARQVRVLRTISNCIFAEYVQKQLRRACLNHISPSVRTTSGPAPHHP